MTTLMQSFVHDPYSSISSKEAFLQDFLEILKQLVTRYGVSEDLTFQNISLCLQSPSNFSSDH